MLSRPPTWASPGGRGCCDHVSGIRTSGSGRLSDVPKVLGWRGPSSRVQATVGALWTSEASCVPPVTQAALGCSSRGCHCCSQRSVPLRPLFCLTGVESHHPPHTRRTGTPPMQGCSWGWGRWPRSAGFLSLASVSLVPPGCQRSLPFPPSTLHPGLVPRSW